MSKRKQKSSSNFLESGMASLTNVTNINSHGKDHLIRDTYQNHPMGNPLSTVGDRLNAGPVSEQFLYKVSIQLLNSLDTVSIQFPPFSAHPSGSGRESLDQSQWHSSRWVKSGWNFLPVSSISLSSLPFSKALKNLVRCSSIL